MNRRRATKWAFIALIALVAGAILCLTVPIDLPWTVSSAVHRIERKWLREHDRELILRNPKETVGSLLHMSLGMRVRNEFGLWGRNWILRKSCGHTHPDDCSGVIIEALWESIRQQAPPATVLALDEQFRQVAAIQIDPNGFHLGRMSDTIARIQAQIDRQTITGHGLHLTVSGDPNLHCYTRADFGGDSIPLEDFFGWISWRNGFEVRHKPPNIELVFYEKCAWPEPPTHFEIKEGRR